MKLCLIIIIISIYCVFCHRNKKFSLENLSKLESKSREVIINILWKILIPNELQNVYGTKVQQEYVKMK